MRSSSSRRSRQQTPVYLNVYSFIRCCNALCGCLGLGLYHSAVEVYGIEFMFHGWAGKQTGVSEVEPKSAPYHFEEQIFLGLTNYSYWEFQEQIMTPLRLKYISNTYDLLAKNCNHFALELAEKLGFSSKHPASTIFRVTDCCNLLRCCLPQCFLSGRMDWFRSSGDDDKELEDIRNSEIRYVQNSGNYQELNEEISRDNNIMEVEEVSPKTSNEGKQIKRSRKKIFITSKN